MDNSKNVCGNCGAKDEPVWYHKEKGTVCHKCRFHLMNLAGLPTDDSSRKALPIFTGVVLYFPDALAAVAHCSKVGNDQHNPGQPLHWAKEKSTDQRNTCLRHMIDAARGTVFDVDGVRHSAKAAWRALAALQTELEQDGLGLFQAPVPVPPLIETETCVCGYRGCVLAHGHLGMHYPFKANVTVTSREGTK